MMTADQYHHPFDDGKTVDSLIQTWAFFPYV